MQHGKDIFKSYDSTSPLIVITDKKKKFQNPNEQEGGRSGNRYALHFGYKRSEDETPRFSFTSHIAPPFMEEHQLMDEGDRAVNPDDLAKALPQLRKIPALQHQSSYLFQSSANPDVMRKKIAYGEVKVPDILKHIHSFPELHRSSSKFVHENFEPKTEHYDSAHNYLMGMMHGYAHSEHPIMKHFFGGKKEGDEPAASHEDQAKFFSIMNLHKRDRYTMDDEHHEPNPYFKHLSHVQIQRIQSNPHVQSQSHLRVAVHRAMEQSEDPVVHRKLFDDLMRRKETNPLPYRHMLRTTSDMSIIRDAMNAVKEGKISASYPGTGPILNPMAQDMHLVHQFVATNPHVPNDVLWHIASTKTPHHPESIIAITNLIKRQSENA